MNKRQKTLKLMAEQAGLAAIKFDCRNSRHYLMCQAENGNRLEFWLSTATNLDPRAEQNELSRMKRFARENAVLTTEAATPTTHLERLKAMPTTTPAQNPVLDLSHAEFLRLAMWLNNQNLDSYPSMDALVLECNKHMGRTVEESSVLSAMGELGKDEPARWCEPTDPQTIIVREVGRMLKELGMTPTDAFAKLAARLLP